MNSKIDALDQALVEYRARLPERALNLESLAKALANGSVASQKELMHQLHRLAGSAGMYGFSQLGQQAKLVHRAFRESNPLSLSDKNTPAYHLLAELLGMMR